MVDAKVFEAQKSLELKGYSLKSLSEEGKKARRQEGAEGVYPEGMGNCSLNDDDALTLRYGFAYDDDDLSSNENC